MKPSLGKRELSLPCLSEACTRDKKYHFECKCIFVLFGKLNGKYIDEISLISTFTGCVKQTIETIITSLTPCKQNEHWLLVWIIEIVLKVFEWLLEKSGFIKVICKSE